MDRLTLGGTHLPSPPPSLAPSLVSLETPMSGLSPSPPPGPRSLERDGSRLVTLATKPAGQGRYCHPL